MSRTLKWLLFSVAVTPVALFAAESNAQPAPGHTFTNVVLFLAVIIIAGKLGGEIAERLGQPAVLGELVAGVALGNLAFTGFGFFDVIKTDASIDMLAQLGVLILLFEVGLESTIEQMLKVGLSAFLVASLGVAAPFALGWLVGAWLLPHESMYAHAFLGATLCATSVGITARVLKDLGRTQTSEARIILGAAVIDDVMGLVILAVVVGIIAAAGSSSGEGAAGVSFGAVAVIVAKAFGFLVGALVVGVWLAPKLFRIASRFQSRGILLAVSLSFCFVLAWLSGVIGLAPIVGAFAAGLILEEFHFRDFIGRGEHTLKELVQPISSFLVPIFFVVMGMRTDLSALAQPGVLALAAALTLAAIAGKQICGLGVVGKGIDRRSVGIGMIPRGEVGLIFANAGSNLILNGQKVIDPSVYSAIVIMVIVTTMITPPLLKWSLHKRPPQS
jgi:Kef-type K+ transport system membrane component KefB